MKFPRTLANIASVLVISDTMKMKALDLGAVETLIVWDMG
jgi:hypothetical protein